MVSAKPFTPEFQAELPAELFNHGADAHTHRTVRVLATIDFTYPKLGDVKGFTNETSSAERAFTISIVPQQDLLLRSDWNDWKHRKRWPARTGIGLAALTGVGFLTKWAVQKLRSQQLKWHKNRATDK